MSQLKLTADSGGGTVAIKGPASTTGNGAIELTVPGTGSSTLATTATAGKILQIVQTVKKDKSTIQSTTLTDIPSMSVTITPSSASNKILIRYCLSVFTNGVYWSMRLLRGSDSTIFIGDQNPSATSQSRGTFGSYMPSYVDGRNVTQEFLDSPNTTSATTYKLQAHCPYSSTYIIGINTSPTQDNYSYMTNCVSTITAMEVAA